VNNGYRIAARNWHVPRTHGRGELDLVCIADRVVVFCEVKTRTSDRYGSGLEAVGPDKQRRIRRLAAAWLQLESRQSFRELRFDIADVDGQGNLVIHRAAF
jgi:putative endonuclease